MNSTKKGSIYIRDNEWYKSENVVKLGISKEVISRNSSYITGELIRGEYIYVIEVPLDNLKMLDGELKIHFKEYQVYKGGGTEFYDKCIVDLIEPFLKQLNFEYKVLSEEEIDLINNSKKIVNKKIDITENVAKKDIIDDSSQIVVNTLVKPYCKQCDKYYSSMSSLCNHNKKYHREIKNSKTVYLNQTTTVKNTILDNILCCRFCKNKFSHRNGRWKHEKNCNIKIEKEKKEQEEEQRKKEDYENKKILHELTVKKLQLEIELLNKSL